MYNLSSVLHPSYGYHPVSTTTLLIPSLENCTFHLLYTLPPSVFVDKYELENYRHSYSFHYWGTSNLEYPVFAVELSASTLLLNVKRSDGMIQIDLPLHLRYGWPAPPSSKTGYVSIKVKKPTCFVSCPPSVNSSLLHASPSQLQEQVGQLLTKNSTQLVTTIVPQNGDTLRVPVGNLGDLAYVEYGTVLTVLVLFCYLACLTIKVAERLALRGQRKIE